MHALALALAADGVDANQMKPVVALVLMTGLTQVISIEATLGVTSGHEEAVKFVNQLIDRLEPATKTG